MRNPAKLAMVARKKTIDVFRKKFYPSYPDMAVSQRVKIDQILQQKHGGLINKLTQKLGLIKQIMNESKGLFSSKICWNFSPDFCLPFYNFC